MKDYVENTCSIFLPNGVEISLKKQLQHLEEIVKSTMIYRNGLWFKENKPILLVEDGAVDIDQLEEDGFYVIVYRQGSTPPKFIKERNDDE